MFSLRSSALSWVYPRDIGADILAYVLAVAAAAVRRTSLSMRIECRSNGRNVMRWLVTSGRLARGFHVTLACGGRNSSFFLVLWNDTLRIFTDTTLY